MASIGGKPGKSERNWTKTSSDPKMLAILSDGIDTVGYSVLMTSSLPSSLRVLWQHSFSRNISQG